MKLKIVLLCIIVLMAYITKAQTNPVPQNLPFSQDFGVSTFNILPQGIAVWNGLSGTSINTQSLAESSVPTGNASITARTSATTTGGAYGLSILSNGRIYIQSSSNSTEGVDQLVFSFHTGSASRIQLSFDTEVIEAGTGRSMGFVLQYRQGNAGVWSTVINSSRLYNHSSLNATDVDVNGDVDNYAWILNGLSANTDYQFRIAHWRSGSAGSSVGLAYDNIHILPLPELFEVTGGGTYCAGSNGMNVKLASSQTGVFYQLLFNGNGQGLPVEGNGGEIDFGIQDQEGSYTVAGNYPGGNSFTMSGEAFIQIQQPPSTSNAGTNQLLCQQSTAVLNAGEPSLGMGSWTQVSGSPVDFSDQLSYQTFISNLSPGTYVFRWTVEYGICPASISDVTISVLEPPSTANAGGDIKVCMNNFQLDGNLPVSGSGKWAVVSGPGNVIFENENLHNTSVSISEPGKYNFKWTISNQNCTPSEDFIEVISNKAPSLINGELLQQTKYYGQLIDPVHLIVRDEDDVPEILEATTSYKLNGSSYSGLPGHLTLQGVQTNEIEKEWILANGSPGEYLPAGTYEIYVSFKDGCGATTITTIQIEILPANVKPLADAFYTGSCFFWTNPNSKTATLALSATVKNSPGTFGDIRTARLSFYIRQGNSLLPIHGAMDLPVGLIQSNDLSKGSASALVQYNLGAANVNVINIAVVVSGNYVANDPATDKTITVAVPVAGGQICGGLNLLNINSQGIISGAPGWETNAGFFVQYNSSLKNPQGKVEIKILSVYDRSGIPGNDIRTYIVRSNSIASLAITNNAAQFSGKANLSEVINGIEQEVEGNCILLLQLVDGDQSIPVSSDKVSISVFKNKGGTWFSGNFNGSGSQLQNILNGNLSVANGNPVQRIFGLPDNSLEKPMQVSVYPNPSQGSFLIRYFSKNANEPIEITIYDLLGKKRYGALHQSMPGMLQIGEELTKGAYILRVKQGVEVQRVIIVKQ